MKSRARACINGCGTDIYFDDDVKSSSNKSIPLEVDNDQPHDCPNNPYQGKTSKSIEQRITDLEERVARLEDTI